MLPQERKHGGVGETGHGIYFREIKNVSLTVEQKIDAGKAATPYDFVGFESGLSDVLRKRLR